MAMKFNLNVLLLLQSFLVCLFQSDAAVYDATQFWRKNDGTVDMSRGLYHAWELACASRNPSTILIPIGTFPLNAIKLVGPCKSPLTIELKGTLKAPVRAASMKSDAWITINYVENLTLFGGGTLDGRGKVDWENNQKIPRNKLPVSIRFNFIKNSLVRDVRTLNSKSFHVNLLGCKNLTFEQFTVGAPDESPNTDGIHMGRCDGINILDSTIKTGDDCISIGHGSRNINIKRVICGPGHGISIGSLGKHKGEKPVSDVSVTNCTFLNTANGVRIKTWPISNPGIVTNIRFEDLVMDSVKIPILIDQEYCPNHDRCGSKKSLVKISNVVMKNIRGSASTSSVVQILCSPRATCENVKVSDIDLVLTKGTQGPPTSICSNVKPITSGKLIPPICDIDRQLSQEELVYYLQ